MPSVTSLSILVYLTRIDCNFVGYPITVDNYHPLIFATGAEDSLLRLFQCMGTIIWGTLIIRILVRHGYKLYDETIIEARRRRIIGALL